MADFTKVQQALERRGYTVRTFAAAEEAAAYLDGAIDGKTVGFGGSATLDALGVYDKLAAHNTVIWHWKQEANAARKAAMQTQVYLSSANGLAESGRSSTSTAPATGCPPRCSAMRRCTLSSAGTSWPPPTRRRCTGPGTWLHPSAPGSWGRRRPAP